MVSFAQIFRDNAPYAWRVLRRLGVREAEVDDLVQEVFIVVHRKLPEFEGRSSLRTWIYGICVRVASDHRRRAHVRREQPTDVLERAGSAPQLREIEQRQQLAQLDAALSELSDDKRAVFVLFEVEQMPMDEVARAVGCPVKTAYSRLYAARDHVKTSFAPGGVGADGAGGPRITTFEPALEPAREDRPSEQRLAAIAAGLGPLFESAGAAGAVGAGAAGVAGAGGSIATKLTVAGAAAVASIAAVIGVVAYSADEEASRAPAATVEVAAQPVAGETRIATETESAADTESDVATATADVSETDPPAPAERPRRRRDTEDEPATPARPEIDILTGAQDALASDPSRALALAAEHARGHPNGMLAQEREVLAIDALLRLGRRDEAEERADAFNARWPRSAQTRRIATLLAPSR